jgi:hypothetical protein
MMIVGWGVVFGFCGFVKVAINESKSLVESPSFDHLFWKTSSKPHTSSTPLDQETHMDIVVGRTLTTGFKRF